MTMKRNDDAVSPVIGVILMVAITVILAAVIAAFVFGLVGGVQSTKVVGMTVSQTDSENNMGEITWHGGANLNDIQQWTVTSPDQVDAKSDAVIGANNGTPYVGQVSQINVTTGKRAIVVAKFKDGTDQVLFDKLF